MKRHTTLLTCWRLSFVITSRLGVIITGISISVIIRHHSPVISHHRDRELRPITLGLAGHKLFLCLGLTMSGWRPSHSRPKASPRFLRQTRAFFLKRNSQAWNRAVGPSTEPASRPHLRQYRAMAWMLALPSPPPPPSCRGFLCAALPWSDVDVRKLTPEGRC